MSVKPLTDEEFFDFKKIVFHEAGINLDLSKKSLVYNRLTKRLKYCKIDNFLDYLRLVWMSPKEKEVMINLITTNETHFFRESEHFEILKKIAKDHPKDKIFRFWSAASSFGAEGYSVAMVLYDIFGDRFEVLGTDINSEVVKKANDAIFPVSMVRNIPENFKKKYCLRGKGEFHGKFTIINEIKRQVKFSVYNLLNTTNSFGMFDVIFLRNVLFYFDDETKTKIVNNVLKNLKIGGYLFVSLTESLSFLEIENLDRIRSSVYKKL